MAIRRALVVDDSRSARVSLQRMLEDQGLEVDLAESGEEALDYLTKHKADVVFMDHTMPGMDGLEAVSLIKSNPETATIPVMMYTTKEGEVYVGQARALGAVGVMPKNVQKHQVFDMLLKLGLVHDRRVPAVAVEERQNNDQAVSRQLEDQAMGISVQSLVGRMLEDQHLTLRSDILRSQKAFAKDVAREVLKEHLSLLEDPAPAAPEPSVPTQSDRPGVRVVGGMLLIALVVTGFLSWHRSRRVRVVQRALTVQPRIWSLVRCWRWRGLPMKGTSSICAEIRSVPSSLTR